MNENQKTIFNLRVPLERMDENNEFFMDNHPLDLINWSQIQEANDISQVG